MKERLTKKDKYGHWYTNSIIYDRGMTSEDGVNYEKHYFENGVSAYDGEPIDRLAEYEDLEEQGLIVRLPCKVGDTIYRRLSKFGFDNWTVGKINIYIATYGIDYSVYAKSVDGCGYDTFYKDDLNEDWFITRAEAEKKLKELKGEEGCI